MFKKEEGKGLKINLKKSLLVVLAAGMLVASPASVYATGVGGNNGTEATDEDYSEATGGDDSWGDDTGDDFDFSTGDATGDSTSSSGNSSSAYSKLAEAVLSSVSDNNYTLADGGTLKGKDIVDKKTGLVNDNYTDLTSKSRQQLLNDMNNAADAQVNKDKGSDSSSKVTEGTKNNWLVNLQKCDGVGSQLLTTVLANTKPDFVTANQIYQPFSGLVGTLLGLGAVLLFAAVAIVMVLDISYMAIPFIRTIGTDDSGSQKRPNWVSYEAYYAIQQAEGGEGGGNTKGAGKQALGIYLKKRIGMLVLLGVCLLYLIQGQIFTFVGWVLDLVSGFIGF